jgi:hypothetical protein
MTLFNFIHCNPFHVRLVLNLTLAPSWVEMGYLLTFTFTIHNVRILSSTSVYDDANAKFSTS